MKSGSRLHRLLPVAYAAVPLLVVAFVLPSALRPPPDSANQGSAYSPDAPPDKNADTIVRSVRQAGSATAGGALADRGHAAPVSSVAPAPSAAPDPLLRASRSGCYPGTPPRQLESVYSVPCEPAFIGDNGGATAAGVTRTDINIVIVWKDSRPPAGEVTDISAQSAATVRTLNDLKKYLNQHMELHGRQIRLFVADAPGATDESSVRAAADDAVARYHPLAVLHDEFTPFTDELNKLGVLSFDTNVTNTGSRRRHNPMSWALRVQDDINKPIAEIVCKELKGHLPKQDTGELSAPAGHFDKSKPRTFGLVTIADPDIDNHPGQLRELQTCGVTPKPDLHYALADPTLAASQMTQMAAAGVSTILYEGDLLSLTAYMSSASANEYYPEWVVAGGGVDQSSFIVRLYDAAQRKNLMGLKMDDIVRDHRISECFRAVRSVDPGYDADQGTCHIWWQAAVLVAGALQLTGPHLTAPALGGAFPELPHLAPDPKNWWAASGFYVKNRKWGFNDSGSLWWWDDNKPDPDGQNGTYVFADCAHRYLAGQWPSRAARIFTTSHAASGLELRACREG